MVSSRKARPYLPEHKQEYQAWRAMIARCNNPRHPNYSDYGGRGIRVCPEWVESFDRFLSDMGTKPYDDYELGRIDIDGHYDPGNACWTTHQNNARNRRTSKRIEFEDETQPLAAWADILGLPYAVLYQRLYRGWPIEKAFATPRSPRKRSSP